MTILARYFRDRSRKRPPRVARSDRRSGNVDTDVSKRDENPKTVSPTASAQSHQTSLTAVSDHVQHGPRITTMSTARMSDYSGLSLRRTTSIYLPWSRRLRHVTWAYFTITMATGGMANVLNAVPFHFRGLYELGLVFFFLNIFLYIVIWTMLITRFFLHPSLFRDSFVHPTESLFVPACAVSFGTMLITINEYGTNRTGPWLNEAVLVLFWFDCALAVILSITIYMILWSTQSFTIAQMTPIWIFPAYPLLIIGPHAVNLATQVSSDAQTIQVIVGGFTIQGIGYLVSLTIYSAFVYRLMTQKLPTERLRPGMFISVGPSAFTVSTLIGLTEKLELTIADWDVFMGIPGLLAAQILRLIANWVSLWLWGTAIWFFLIAALSNMQCFSKAHRMPFAMTWFSFVFPQTALCTATFAVARAFDIHALQIVGCVMTVLLVLVYIFVVFMMFRAVARHDILWPEKGEDKDEGGFRRKRSLESSDLEQGNLPSEQGHQTGSLGVDADMSVRRRSDKEVELQDMANGDQEADDDQDLRP